MLQKQSYVNAPKISEKAKIAVYLLYVGGNVENFKNFQKIWIMAYYNILIFYKKKVFGIFKKLSFSCLNKEKDIYFLV